MAKQKSLQFSISALPPSLVQSSSPSFPYVQYSFTLLSHLTSGLPFTPSPSSSLPYTFYLLILSTMSKSPQCIVFHPFRYHTLNTNCLLTHTSLTHIAISILSGTSPSQVIHFHCTYSRLQWIHQHWVNLQYSIELLTRNVSIYRANQGWKWSWREREQ